MLSIGQFSNICKVLTKPLRYYDEIGLLLPDEINLENGYRYYSIKQLEKMLFINRLKSYNFSLEEIKAILASVELTDEALYLALIRKKNAMAVQVQEFEKTISQLISDISKLKQGKSMMSYLEEIDVRLSEVPKMYLLSIRKMVQETDFAQEYEQCFNQLFKKSEADNLTLLASPMVLFHSVEYSPFGLDTEFAIPVKEYVTGTRDFYPGLCLKTIVYGSYSDLPSVYAKQLAWAEKEGYENSDALFEVYTTDPNQVAKESGLITEVYYPIKKKDRTLTGECEITLLRNIKQEKMISEKQPIINEKFTSRIDKYLK